jgi:hypothetical protein
LIKYSAILFAHHKKGFFMQNKMEMYCKIKRLMWQNGLDIMQPELYEAMIKRLADLLEL